METKDTTKPAVASDSDVDDLGMTSQGRIAATLEVAATLQNEAPVAFNGPSSWAIARAIEDYVDARLNALGERVAKAAGLKGSP